MASRVLPFLARSSIALPLFQRLIPGGTLSCLPAASAYLITHKNIHSSSSLNHWRGIPLSRNGSGNPLLSLPPAVCPAKRHMTYLVDMTKKFVRERVLLVMQLYDKINPEKLTLESHFHKDLGLDSLDHVEIIMAIEDEFGFELPDRDAQRLLTPASIVQYVCDKFDVFDEDEHHHGGHHDEPGHQEPDDPWADNKPYKPAHH